MKIYLIPGLGFDHRIFEKLEFGAVEYNYLNWIEPKTDEQISDYAARISAVIDFDQEEIILIGHSLGGIMAQEIAALKPVAKIVLISSIKSREELPIHFRIVKPLSIYKLFSKELTAKTIKFWGKYHEYETAEEQALVVDMVNKQSNKYLQWALRQLSIWKEPKMISSTKIFHLHGNKDKTFPFKLIREPDIKIENAGHYMVSRKSNLINEILKKEILN